jgi:hypothetical protein
VSGPATAHIGRANRKTAVCCDWHICDVQGPAGVKSCDQVSRPDRQLKAYENAVLSLADAAHCALHVFSVIDFGAEHETR